MVSLFEVVRHVGHHSHPQESSRHCGKPVRPGFVDLGPSLETKRVPPTMEVYLTSCKIRARRVFRSRNEDTVQPDRSLSQFTSIY